MLEKKRSPTRHRPPKLTITIVHHPPLVTMYPRTQEKSRLHINTRVASSNGSPTFDPPPAAKGDLLIARYQGLAKKVHWVRFLLFGVAFGASVAVVGFSGSALHNYSEIGPQGDWMIPLWPKTVDLRPAHTILAFGITTTVFSLTYLVASFVPLVSSRQSRQDGEVTNTIDISNASSTR